MFISDLHSVGSGLAVDNDLLFSAVNFTVTFVTILLSSTQVACEDDTVGKLDDADTIVGITQLGEFWVLDGLAESKDSVNFSFGIGAALRYTNHPSRLVNIVYTNVGEDTTRSGREFNEKPYDIMLAWAERMKSND